jgi:hypothetical protein
MKLTKAQQDLVDRFDAGEDIFEDAEIVEIEVKRPRDKVMSLRLPTDKWDTLRHEAKELGVTPTTLARLWILEHLKAAAPSN